MQPIISEKNEFNIKEAIVRLTALSNKTRLLIVDHINKYQQSGIKIDLRARILATGINKPYNDCRKHLHFLEMAGIVIVEAEKANPIITLVPERVRQLIELSENIVHY